MFAKDTTPQYFSHFMYIRQKASALEWGSPAFNLASVMCCEVLGNWPNLSEAPLPYLHGGGQDASLTLTEYDLPSKMPSM